MDKVLLISNERAGSASPRTKEVIVKALQADFKLEVADTQARDHASELARDAVDRDFDAVLVFGGDGTINEAAQGVIGTDVALGVLPGGSTNVMARSLGIPLDPVEATAFVAGNLRSKTMRRINVGRINERYFVFSAGMGLDAEVVKRVEAQPEKKQRNHDWTFVKHAFNVGLTEYRGADPFITLEVEGHEPERVLLGICCNGRPFTYMGNRPVDVCPEAHLDQGLDLFAIKKVRLGTVARLPWAVFVSRAHVRYRHAIYHHDIPGATLVADQPLPVQVDGDYIGEKQRGDIVLVPEALDLLV